MTRAIRPAPVPVPREVPVLGHLWQWTVRPLALLRAGAAAGPVFGLRLWRPALVGYRPEWNRAVLGDTDAFVSRGSLSGFTPYLAAGIVHTDQPAHRPRRQELNRGFSGHAVAEFADRLTAVVDSVRPTGPFEALAWSGLVVRRMLNEALFGSALPDPLLRRFLAPLHRRTPIPMLPRPVLFGRMDAAIAAALADPPPGCIAGHLAGADDAVEQARTALAAGYDTTAHTLAWALWELAAAPDWHHPDGLDAVVDEVLRLYPAGWIGSRVAARDVTAAGVDVPAGTLVLYSPYLSHRDPDRWTEPDAFRPGRAHPERSWSYLPFAAGPRTCLGAHLARLMLRTALGALRPGMSRLGGDATPRTGLTLRPRGPLVLRPGTESPVRVR